jgi:hypothetical protein
MEVLVSDRSRMIPAHLFRAWWIRLIALNDQHRRDALFRIGLQQQPVRATQALVAVDDGPPGVPPHAAAAQACAFRTSITSPEPTSSHTSQLS